MVTDPKGVGIMASVCHTSSLTEVTDPKGVGIMASKLDLASTTQLFVAGCGRLQLEVAKWVIFVEFLKWLIIVPTNSGVDVPDHRRLDFLL